MPKTEAATAPVVSATERTELARKQIAALHIEQQKIAEDIALAVIAGQDPAPLKERRATIADKLEDLNVLIRELSRDVELETRCALLRDFDAAMDRMRDRERRVQEKRREHEALLEQAKALEIELWTIQHETTGHVSIGDRLRAHREQHPWISEEMIDAQ